MKLIISQKKIDSDWKAQTPKHSHINPYSLEYQQKPAKDDRLDLV